MQRKSNVFERYIKNYHSLNIDIYVEDNFLNVRFDRQVASTPYKPSPLANLYAVAASCKTETSYQIPEREIIRHIFHISPDNPENSNSFKGTQSKNDFSMSYGDAAEEFVPFVQETIIYKMSQIPHVLINWIAFYSIFINSTNDRYSKFQNIHFGSHLLLDENIDTENCVSTSVSTLIKKLISFKDKIPAYSEALNDLDKIYKYYVASRETDKPKKFLECLSPEIRCEILYNEQLKKLKNAGDTNQRELLIQGLAKEMTSKKEFLFMMDIIHTHEKIALFTPCLGQIAKNGGSYDKSFTELLFIYFAEICLFPDGRVGIANLDMNPAYIDFYANGKLYHDRLTDELLHLAPYLPLKFDIDCNIHEANKIMISQEYSKRLIDQGLLINSNYCKALFNVHNKWAFFTRVKLAGDNIFQLLSDDILDTILEKTASPHQCLFYNNKNPGFIQAVQSGKARGNAEHKEVENRRPLSPK